MCALRRMHRERCCWIEMKSPEPCAWSYAGVAFFLQENPGR